MDSIIHEGPLKGEVSIKKKPKPRGCGDSGNLVLGR